MHGAVLAVSDTTAEENGGAGIALDNSAADLTDCTLQRNAGGLDMFRTLHGGSQGRDQRGGQLTDPESSSTLSRCSKFGARWCTADNNSVGLFIDHSTRRNLRIRPRRRAAPSPLNGNSGEGIAIAAGSLTVYGGKPLRQRRQHDQRLEQWHGRHLASRVGEDRGSLRNGEVSLSRTIRSVSTSVTGSGAAIIGGLSVRNNETGVLADGAGSLTFVSVPPNPSAIENNETDVDLLFGSRLTAGGAPLGPVHVRRNGPDPRQRRVPVTTPRALRFGTPQVETSWCLRLRYSSVLGVLAGGVGVDRALPAVPTHPRNRRRSHGRPRQMPAGRRRSQDGALRRRVGSGKVASHDPRSPSVPTSHRRVARGDPRRRRLEERVRPRRAAGCREDDACATGAPPRGSLWWQGGRRSRATAGGGASGGLAHRRGAGVDSR